jgi:hypothetical protein
LYANISKKLPVNHNPADLLVYGKSCNDFVVVEIMFYLDAAHFVFIAAAFFASAQYTPEIKNFNGLNTATFKTDEGNINVYFSDLQEGDIISGTVLAEPSGKNERQKDRNSNVISGYVVEIENDDSEEDKIDVKDKLFRWEIPAVVATGLKLVLKGPGGKVLGSGEIPVIKDSPYMEIPSVITEDNFAVPDFIQSGSNTSVGDATTNQASGMALLS